jgi:hypothetical protein
MISSPGAYSRTVVTFRTRRISLVDEVAEQRHAPQDVHLARQLLGAILGAAVAPRSTRTTMAVMLSWPPPALAWSMSAWGVRRVLALEHLDDARLVEVGVQAVRAEQELVAGQDLEVDRRPDVSYTPTGA